MIGSNTTNLEWNRIKYDWANLNVPYDIQQPGFEEISLNEELESTSIFNRL